MDHSPTNPHPLHIPVISIPHPLGHSLLPALPSENIHRVVSTSTGHINRSQPHLLHIPQHALLKPTQSPLEAHHLSPAHGRQVQAFRHSNIAPRIATPHKANVPAHQARLPDRVEHARRVPAAHIGPQ